MIVFEVGKEYNCGDCDISPILVINRTAKMCQVVNEDGSKWRMMIRNDGDSEIMIDSSVPKKWREVFTYRADDQARG